MNDVFTVRLGIENAPLSPLLFIHQRHSFRHGVRNAGCRSGGRFGLASDEVTDDVESLALGAALNSGRRTEASVGVRDELPVGLRCSLLNGLSGQIA